MKLGLFLGSAAAAAFVAGLAHAEVWNGTAYYTYFSGQRVASITYSYDDVGGTFSLGSEHVITTLPGADGLLFAPGGTHLLVTGQGPTIYNVDVATGTFTSTNIPGPGAFHPAISGSTFYTSGPYGQSDAPLVSATVGANGALSNIQSQNVTGADSQVTQLAFVDGQVFYDNSQPNCCGNVGVIDLTTGVTTQIASGVTSAHGMVVDPYTGLIDLFGGGWLGTLDPVTHIITQNASTTTSDFDQGAPDGFGHALIAGSNGITFVDYRSGGDITHPEFATFVSGFTDIDDIAPLAGAGSGGGGVPEPAAWALMIVGLGAAGAMLRRQRLRLA